MQLRRLEIVDTWEQESAKTERLESKELKNGYWMHAILSPSLVFLPALFHSLKRQITFQLQMDDIWGNKYEQDCNRFWSHSLWNT
jgi:hypothetical protein